MQKKTKKKYNKKNQKKNEENRSTGKKEVANSEVKSESAVVVPEIKDEAPKVEETKVVIENETPSTEPLTENITPEQKEAEVDAIPTEPCASINEPATVSAPSQSTSVVDDSNVNQIPAPVAEVGNSSNSCLLDTLLTEIVAKNEVDFATSQKKEEGQRRNEEKKDGRNGNGNKGGKTTNTRWKTDESQENVNKPPVQLEYKVKLRTMSSQTEESMPIGTEVEWRKRDNMVSFENIRKFAQFDAKFGAFLLVIDSEIRYTAGCEMDMIEQNGVKSVFEMFALLGLKNPWPFDNPTFTMNETELREVLKKILDAVKFCLFIECMKHGYTYMPMKKKRTISRVWLKSISSLNELNFFKALFSELKLVCKRFELDYESIDLAKELTKIFEETMPDLAMFSSDRLAMNGISDDLSSIKGRIHLGFEVTPKDIDNMLESSLQDKGFGDFPCTADACVTMFTTANQLRMIHPKIESMFSITDVRIRFSALKAITNIFLVLPPDERSEIFDELGDKPKLDLKNVLGMEPQEFEVMKDHNLPKREKYMRVFFTALSIAEIREDTQIDSNGLAAALMALYLIFNTEQVNHIVFKILSTRLKVDKPKEDSKTSAVAVDIGKTLDADRDMFVEALLKIPISWRKRVEVGPEFMQEDDKEDESTESMYYQVKQCLKTTVKPQECTNKMDHFLTVKAKTDFVSPNRIFCIFMNCIEKGVSQRNAADAFNLLQKPHIQEMYMPIQLIEDLVYLGLKKYSTPDGKNVRVRYEFICTVLNACFEITQKKQWSINEKSMLPKWKSLCHPWFAELYLSKYFYIISLPNLDIEYPWKAPDMWDESKSESAEETVRPEKYAKLAMLSTAWPDCHDGEFIEYVVEEVVPEEVPRFELYQEMKKYVEKLQIADSWKANLRKTYDSLLKKFGRSENNLESEEENILMVGPSGDIPADETNEKHKVEVSGSEISLGVPEPLEKSEILPISTQSEISATDTDVKTEEGSETTFVAEDLSNRGTTTPRNSPEKVEAQKSSEKNERSPSEKHKLVPIEEETFENDSSLMRVTGEEKEMLLKIRMEKVKDSLNCQQLEEKSLLEVCGYTNKSNKHVTTSIPLSNVNFWSLYDPYKDQTFIPSNIWIQFSLEERKFILESRPKKEKSPHAHDNHRTDGRNQRFPRNVRN